MSQVHKFQSKRKPIVFEIEGEQFTATRSVPGWTFVEFTRTLKNTDGLPSDAQRQIVQEQSEAVFAMFAAVMEEVEFERFRKFAAGPLGPDMDTLMEVLNVLAGQQADRPTEPPSPSEDGQETTGTT